MCGFAGYINDSKDINENRRIIKEMADRIIHRGPDQDDYYVDEDVSLGFRRLSIIDLEGGSQPILNEDGTKVLVFNGEIYNYKELREEQDISSRQKQTARFFFMDMRSGATASWLDSEECLPSLSGIQ